MQHVEPDQDQTWFDSDADAAQGFGKRGRRRRGLDWIFYPL